MFPQGEFGCYRTLLIACVMLHAVAGHGQSNISVRAGSVYAVNSVQAEINEEEVRVTSRGFEGGVDGSYVFRNSPFSTGAGVAVKQLYSDGSVGTMQFSGTTFRVLATLHGSYSLSDHWIIGAVFLVENNRDYKDMRILYSDKLRYNLGLHVGYELAKRLHARLRYTHSLYPNENVYLIHNPSDQLWLGLSYRLFHL